MPYWRWERDKECIEEWAEGHAPNEVREVIDVVDRVTQNSPDNWPGTIIRDSPSEAFRELCVGQAVIKFTVCDSFARGILYMVCIQDV